MRRLVWNFAVRICSKVPFLSRRPIYTISFKFFFLKVFFLFVCCFFLCILEKKNCFAKQSMKPLHEKRVIIAYVNRIGSGEPGYPHPRMNHAFTYVGGRARANFVQRSKGPGMRTEIDSNESPKCLFLPSTNDSCC